MMQATQDAASKLRRCMAQPRLQDALLQEASEAEPNATKPGANATKCKEEKENLEKTYVQVYVELSRLKGEYEVLANDTSCSDTIMEQYRERQAPTSERADELSGLIAEREKFLAALRPRFEHASVAHEKLVKHTASLGSQCKEVEPAISDLNKVRDAITALSLCPGLSRVEFLMPKWIGSWVTMTQDATKQRDSQQDFLMDQACSAVKEDSRAAEINEIAEQTVEGIPTKNTAPEPLLGKCPGCEGDLDKDKSLIEGHARACWQANATLSLKEMTGACVKGKKVVLCVVDQGNIRQIPR